MCAVMCLYNESYAPKEGSEDNLSSTEKKKKKTETVLQLFTGNNKPT